jgi:DNA-binding NarL/FixJ family response regulator
VLSEKISDVLARDYVRVIGRDGASAFVVLSAREREVLQLIAEGRSTREVAAELNVSIKTIETHRRQIMEKLDIHSIAELTKYAIREGITGLS